MGRLLGMYIHTHWSYNHPYASRTWTLDEWKGYLTGLKGLGYNLVQIWPMLDTMPVPPTPSDVEHLEKLRQVIDFAHDKLGITVYVGISPNTSVNDKASNFTYQDRDYFEVESLIDPSDKFAMDREMERRRVLLEPLAEADGLWVLDCDPGGYKGSPVSEFVDILARHRQMLDRIGSGIRLVYWMWAGWADVHRFDPGWTENVQSVWMEALEGLMKVNPEPWAVHACMPGHFKTIREVGLPPDKVFFYPYNLVEYEPSYPFTNWEPERIADAFEKFSCYRYDLGTLGNSQTHCVQIPHAYVFSHIAQGGSLDTLDPAGFGERLIPGAGKILADAWRAMAINIDDPQIPRKAILPLESLVRSRDITGELGGLFFGDVRRYLTDLILQLGLWANILTLKHTAKDSGDLRPTLTAVFESLSAWNARHGFRDRYHDVYYYSHVHPIYKEALAGLKTPEGDRAAELTDMFTGPSHGRTLRLLDAMKAALCA